ncbi:MAG: hypothetical protein EPO31_06675 [Gammaproteobacteria bacterium]|nr:MAG: hypothetical protein EPO31_06675 [Gammaproteobacteria bacterium]
MTNRRSFLKLGVATAALPLAGYGIHNALAGPVRKLDHTILIDSRYPESRDFAAQFDSINTVQLAGADALAQYWYGELRPALRGTPLNLVGLTGGDTLFCLEMLARELRMKTSLVFPAPVANLEKNTEWARQAARSVAATLHAATQFKPQQQIRDRETLYAWVIAPVTAA